jgi:hypothetical protein
LEHQISSPSLRVLASFFKQESQVTESAMMARPSSRMVQSLMLLKLAIYVPLWASCLLICLSLTLMLVVRIPELLTPQIRVVLLRVCCYAGLLFLLCTGQWIYALVLIGFMFDKFDHAYRRWLEEPTDKSLREAYLWLLLGGCLGVVEALGRLPAIFRPVMRVLNHPVLSIGLIVAFFAVVCWRLTSGAKTNGAPTSDHVAK